MRAPGPAALLVTGHPAWLSALFATLLVTVHLFVDRVVARWPEIRRMLVSIGGGVSVAYVFGHALPAFEHVERVVTESGVVFHPVTAEVYLIVLFGFTTYYGLEHLVRESVAEDGDGEASVGVFWVHIAAFAAYNGLIGYLLFHPEAPGVGHVWVFGLAMAWHFVVTDEGMYERHREVYCGAGRWVLASAVVVGALLGAATEIDAAILGLLFAFLSGAIVFNVVKEELPAERSRFWPFALGVGGYALLLLLV